jgi:hypothetical protein
MPRRPGDTGANLCHLRDGKGTRPVIHLDSDDAFAELELERWAPAHRA